MGICTKLISSFPNAFFIFVIFVYYVCTSLLTLIVCPKLCRCHSINKLFINIYSCHFHHVNSSRQCIANQHNKVHPLSKSKTQKNAKKTIKKKAPKKKAPEKNPLQKTTLKKTTSKKTSRKKKVPKKKTTAKGTAVKKKVH